MSNVWDFVLEEVQDIDRTEAKLIAYGHINGNIMRVLSENNISIFHVPNVLASIDAYHKVKN